MVVFVNRYDGIDLPDNSCRILIIDSKPFFDSLLDRYEESCRSSSDIINIRIAQKVEQGLGRSVRGEKDYSIIILIGGDLIQFIKSPITNKYFSAQTRKQIDIGMKVVEFAKEDLNNKNAYEIVAELMKQSLFRDEGWKNFYVEEMENVKIPIDMNDLYNVLVEEYEAEKCFTLGSYEQACTIMQKLCNQFENNRDEKGWYLQQLARYKYRISKVASNEIQRSAFKNNLQLLKPIDGIVYSKLEYINENRIIRIKKWVSQHNNYQEMMVHIDGIFSDLTFGMQAEKFETAMQVLGESLGFLSQRPDKEIKKGSDNLWCGVNNEYFLIECKSEIKEDRLEISKSEAGQMNSHSAWFENIYGAASCNRILVTPTIKLSYYADFTHEVKIMRKNKLKLLKDNVKSFFKEFSQYDFNGISDAKMQGWFDTHRLTINDIKNEYSEDYKKMSYAANLEDRA